MLSRPFYAESMAAYYRLGAAPSFALTTETRRLVREAADTIVPMPVVEDTADTDRRPVPETVPLGAVLDELVAGSLPTRPEPLTRRATRTGWRPPGSWPDPSRGSSPRR